MKYYIPAMLFRRFEEGKNIISWSGTGRCVGVIPVYNSIDVCIDEHPNTKIITLDTEDT